jgi:hypothetical protein
MALTVIQKTRKPRSTESDEGGNVVELMDQ